MKAHREAIVRCETQDDIRSLFELWSTPNKDVMLSRIAPHTFLLREDGQVTHSGYDFDVLRETRTANFWGTFTEYLNYISVGNISVNVDEYL